ncbi:hypothetical protein EDB80DRAFT_191372 [Ilyonectria destructans]|nr:hypothetical protein EDB80DRAFT_191372 [Ilyonectria destructans]
MDGGRQPQRPSLRETRRETGEDNAWKKRDRGRLGLIKWPMAASPARPTRSSCPMGHPRPGTSQRTRIAPGLAFPWLLFWPQAVWVTMGSWTHRPMAPCAPPLLLNAAQRWPTSQKWIDHSLGLRLTRNAPQRNGHRPSRRSIERTQPGTSTWNEYLSRVHVTCPRGRLLQVNPPSSRLHQTAVRSSFSHSRPARASPHIPSAPEPEQYAMAREETTHESA